MALRDQRKIPKVGGVREQGTARVKSSSLPGSWASISGQTKLLKRASQLSRLQPDSQILFNGEQSPTIFPSSLRFLLWRFLFALRVHLAMFTLANFLQERVSLCVCVCAEHVCVWGSFKYIASCKVMLRRHTLTHSSMPALAI